MQAVRVDGDPRADGQAVLRRDPNLIGQLHEGLLDRLDHGQNYISASPTACPLRGYGHAGTQNDRLGPRRSF